jgi:phosphatidylethanolamine/phosphatidyl-N-methylethanolamine N-methyltransferase
MTNASRTERPTARGETRTPSNHADALRDGVKFLRGFLRNPAQVGSVIPSSHHLEQRLVQCARAHEAKLVVELGPGTGGTTAALLKAMSPSAVLLGIELDGDFYRHLRSTLRDPRLLLEQGSAESLSDYMDMHGLAAPDAIVSGIPFSTMPADVSDRIAATITHVLRPGGRFVAYQVRAHVADFVAPYLGDPDTEWEMVNVPPVRVFTWVKR